MRTTSQRRVRQLHELLKLVSQSTKCTSGASWTGARAASKCAGVRRGDFLPSHCAIHETSYSIQVLSLHALSCISVSLPSVTRATLYVPSARARPQAFLKPEKAASVKRHDAVLGNFYLHSWCPIVVRHGGNARLLRRVVAD